MSKKLTSLALAAVSGVAFAQTDLSEIPIGFQAGIYYPTNSDIRSALGSSWLSFGFAAVRPETRSGIRMVSDVGITTRSANGNRVFMIRPSAGIVKVFGSEDATAKPYTAVRAGFVYADYKVTTGRGLAEGKRVQFGVNSEFGVVFNRKFVLSARYDWIGKFNGLDFNGLSINATIRF